MGSLEIIQQAKDIDIEFNIKLLIFGLILFYSLWFLWWSRDKEYETISKSILLAWGKISSMVFIFNLPFMIAFFMYRGTIEQLLFFLIGYYIITYAVLFGFGQVFTVETIIKIWGWATGLDHKMPKFRNIMKR